MAGIGTDVAWRIAEGRHSDPFSILGRHIRDGAVVVRAYHPDAEGIDVLDMDGIVLGSLAATAAPGVFSGFVPALKPACAYRLAYRRGHDRWTSEDPYRFGPVLGELDEYLIGEGAHRDLWQVLGAHVIQHEGVSGTHFAVWAPNALRVSVVGDFNAWDGRRHAMRRRGVTGVWEIFLPGLGEGVAYKYEILGADGVTQPQKADPVGFGAEHPPRTASVVRTIDGFAWGDDAWRKETARTQWVDRPMSIYEVHLGSWRRVAEDGMRPLSYAELAEHLIPYVQEMGFTHLELMPISEYPFDGSWGYQPVGLFAPTIRHGTPDEFRGFVNACHQAGLGMILDWVPGHFPSDAHGLGRFDGTALYEHEDRREGFHPDWNTLVYNYGRREVANFLVANALYWLREHHIDGLRVDAVASMLYRDYSRKAGEWIPNIHGGRENLEAIALLKQVNEAVYASCPGIATFAEESTAFPGVTAPTDAGGLGFGFKWNMGWMNDTLSYISQDPIHRKYHHHKMTFGIHYGFSENFVLPLSHDEVVHGKGSLLDRMPGGGDDKFANLRAYYGFMWGHPGKKLLFMGQDFAQGAEWNHDAQLDWHLTEHTQHAGMQRLVRDLNALYRDTPAMHENDCRPEGFRWVEDQAGDESLLAWLRFGKDGTKPVLVVSNFTPVERSSRRIGVPSGGRWIERLNTDSEIYGGSGRGNLGGLEALPVATLGFAFTLEMTVPPLATLFFELDG